MKPHLRLNRLPKKLRMLLTWADEMLLEEITYLCGVTSWRSPSGARYAICGEAYLAKEFGLCRSYVSERIQYLEKIGMLNVIHRRKNKGRWMTNLYRIGPVLMDVLTNCCRELTGVISLVSHRVGFSRHIASTRTKRDHSEPGKSGAPPPAPLPAGHAGRGDDPPRRSEGWQEVMERLIQKAHGLNE